MQRLLESVLALLVAIAVLPYSNIYKRNTRDPLILIMEQDNDTAAVSELQRWAKRKHGDPQYVKVAVGSVIF